MFERQNYEFNSVKCEQVSLRPKVRKWEKIKQNTNHAVREEEMNFMKSMLRLSIQWRYFGQSQSTEGKTGEMFCMYNIGKRLIYSIQEIPTN